MLVRADGTIAEKAYYLPWGGERGNTSITSTDYGYTGQMREGDIYYYGARWPQVPEAQSKGFDPTIGRFLQADTIVPLQVQGTQAFDRYAYVNNNPLRYTDPTGQWIESGIDVLFIMFDFAVIASEGATPMNVLSLAVDVAFLLLPGMTGGGPALRLAMEGADAGLTIAKSVATVPEVARAIQYGLKGFQAFDNIDNSQNTNGSRNKTKPEPPSYPEVIDPRTGKPIPQPSSEFKVIPENQRSPWTKSDKGKYIKEWYNRGFPEPSGGWHLYEIHHILQDTLEVQMILIIWCLC